MDCVKINFLWHFYQNKISLIVSFSYHYFSFHLGRYPRSTHLLLFLKFPMTTSSSLLTLCDLYIFTQLCDCLASIFYHTIHSIFQHYSPRAVKYELWQTAPLFLWLYFIYKSLQVRVVIWNFHRFYSLLCNLEDYLQSVNWHKNNLFFRLEGWTSVCTSSLAIWATLCRKFLSSPCTCLWSQSLPWQLPQEDKAETESIQVGVKKLIKGTVELL